MRFFVIKQFLHRDMIFKAGTSIDEKTAYEIFGNRIAMAVRRCYLFDKDLEFDISHRERSAQRKRLLLLRELKSEKAEEIIQQIKDAIEKKIGKKRQEGISAIIDKDVPSSSVTHGGQHGIGDQETSSPDSLLSPPDEPAVDDSLDSDSILNDMDNLTDDDDGNEDNQDDQENSKPIEPLLVSKSGNKKKISKTSSVKKKTSRRTSKNESNS
jgi:hypothetical protein